MTWFSLKMRVLFSILFMMGMAGTALADTPPVARLVPNDTVLFLTVPNVADMKANFANTNLGKMLQDPEMAPFVQALYGEIGEVAAEMKNSTGMGITDWFEAIEGEFMVAVLPMKEASPAFVLLFHPRAEKEQAVHDFFKTVIDERPQEKAKETISGTECTVIKNKSRIRSEDEDGNPVEEVIERPAEAFFEREGRFVFTSNFEAAKKMLDIWANGKTETLADNYYYSSIFNRCKGAKEKPAQVFFYIDPINLFRANAEDSPQSRIAAAMIPVLGFDGLKGLGAGIVFDEGQYDTVAQGHVMLDTPRSGVINVIAMQPIASKPEAWVPHDSIEYFSFSWNFETAFSAIAKVYDSVAGAGAFSQMAHQRLGKELGCDIESELLPALDGRVSSFTWGQQPYKTENVHTEFAIKLKDAKVIEKVLETIKSKQESINVDSYRGKSYFTFEFTMPGSPDAPKQTTLNPCIGIVDNYLMISSGPAIYRKVIDMLADGGKTLGEELDYKLVTGRIDRATKKHPPALVGFKRQEESMKILFETLNDPAQKEQLEYTARMNPVYKAFLTAMEKNPLPPFDSVKKYITPTGYYATDEGSCLHFQWFSMKRSSD